MDMSEALDEWLKQVSKAAQLSIKDQEKITKAGADVLAENCKKIRRPNTRIQKVPAALTDICQKTLVLLLVTSTAIIMVSLLQGLAIKHLWQDS